MSRSLIILLGAMCWTIVALDVFVHVVRGDLVVPLVLVAILVGWAAIRGSLMLRSRAAIATEPAPAQS